MQNRALGALAAALLLCCAHSAPATSEPLRVLYAEPFQAQATSSPGVQKAGPVALRVQAFGREFDLELEDNSRLLRATSAQARNRIGAIQLLKGTVKNAPGSWVRLALEGGRYSGAFWDGSDLYVIEPREQLEPQLLVPLPAAATGIYRLSDTQGGLFEGTCAVEGSAAPPARPLARFRALIGELQTAADTAFAAAPSREIEISMVGDFEFTSRLGSNAVSTMVARMNVVDGIFASQVGVRTIPTDFITFASNSDPFTASDASTLLNQFADYRDTTPLVRSRGLAHLLTGRPLNGSTIGIAFLNSLCRSREGASLSESSVFIDSALIIAHELGHNFGAPHDAEPGSPCAATPASFIMAPELNFSTQFSTCSVQQMQPRIQAATCMVNRNRDLAVSVAADEIEVVFNQPFEYLVDVQSVGDSPALNGVLTFTTGGLQILAASMPDATCGPGGGGVRCELGEIPAGQSRRLTLSLQAGFVGETTMLSAVTSTADSNDANNSRTVTVRSQVARALRIDIGPQPLVGPTDQPVEVTYDIAATGALILDDVRAELQLNSATATAASADGGTCTIEVPNLVHCQLAAVAPGTPRRIRVQWVADVGANASGTARAFDASVPNVESREFYFVSFLPARDARLDLNGITGQVAAVGAEASWSLAVVSGGTDAVDDVHLRLSTPPEVTLTLEGAIASSCTTIAPDTVDCPLGTLPAQTRRTVQFRTRADVVINAQIRVEIVLPQPDDLAGNEIAVPRLDVRVGNEVRLEAFAQSSAEEHRTGMSVVVFSDGANPSENVQVTLALPAGFIVEEAFFGERRCTIDGAASAVTCLNDRIELFRPEVATLQYIAPQAGTFTGTVEVSASGDTDLTNNSQQLTFAIRPNVDGGLIGPPQPPLGRNDMPLDMVFTVTTNKYALPDAVLQFGWFGRLDHFSASAPGAVCGATLAAYRCEWPSIPANSAVPVRVRAESTVSTSGTIHAGLTSAADETASNNVSFVPFAIVVPGDVGVNVTQPAITTTVDEGLNVPGINIVTLRRLESPFIELTFDPTRLQSVILLNGSCIPFEQPMRCVVNGMEVPGTRSMNLQVVPRVTGVASLGIRVGAFNDFNATNDAQTLTLTIVDRPPPTPSPPTPSPPAPSSRGGGGGGSMSWLLAAALLLMWQHRRAQRRVHRQSST